MIDFTKCINARKRQDSIIVEGIEYKIHTEFFHWVLFQRVAVKVEYYEQFNWLYDGKIPDDLEAGYKELEKFYINQQPLPHDLGEKSDVIGVDWKIDSEYIRAAFLEKYQIDLLTTNIHWHCFLSLFHSLKDTAINDIMNARFYKKPEKKKVDPMERARKMWELVRQAMPKRGKNGK